MDGMVTTSPSPDQLAPRQAITAMPLLRKGLGTTSKARPGGRATLVGGLNIRKAPELTQKGICLCYNGYMSNMNIRSFPDDVLKDLRIEAARRGMTLRGLVIAKLAGDKLEFKPKEQEREAPPEMVITHEDVKDLFFPKNHALAGYERCLHMSGSSQCRLLKGHSGGCNG